MIELRDATGLTQQLLADFANISRGVLAMGELGLRALQSNVMQKIISLWSHVPPSADPANLPLITDVLAKESIEADRKIADYKEFCRLKAANKQLELDKMILKYQQSLRLHQTLRAYGNQLPQNQENAATISWIDGATSFATLKLADNSLAKQQLLALEIRQLLSIVSDTKPV